MARWLAVFSGLAIACAGCASDSFQAVTVEPAPAPGVVQFVVEDLRLFYGLTVMTCEGRVMWTLASESQSEPARRIAYGTTPKGFSIREGPKPLTPGCYDVVVSGPARARFEIGADGKLVPPRPHPDSTPSRRPGAT